jgi:septum formation protein
MNDAVFPEKENMLVEGYEAGFVLASASPRRMELLRKVLKTFAVIIPNIDENRFGPETSETYAMRVSRWKAEQVAEQELLNGRDIWVLAADTVVVLGENIMGKPRDAEEARTMLSQLQGRVHEVVTGVCLVNRKRSVLEQRAVRSRVWMKRLESDEIDAYVQSGEPFDKAGGYAIQGLAGGFVLRVDGSYTNVVGLPMEYLQELFQRKGIG